MRHKIATLRRNHLYTFSATTIALSLLAGCASHPAQPPKPDEAKVKQFAGRGYLTDDRYNVATTFVTWTIGEQKFDIAFTVPAKAGAFPLLIYLPALGEGRNAGGSLRTAWAQGGYAVMSVQPLADDANAWSSSYARTGDFSALAHERYSVRSVRARLDALRTVLVELAQHPHNVAPLDHIDLTRVAIVGYDLGAYTAMIVAGESLRGMDKPVLPFPVRAIVALSPYSSFSGAAFADRYGNIAGPVLSVTSDIDSDPLGMVTSPSLRKAPFQYMPAGGKLLLTLSDLSHAAIGGGNANDAIEGGQHSHNPDSGNSSDSEGGSGKRGGRHRGGGNGNNRMGDDGQEGMTAIGASLSPTSRAIGITAIQGVTTAFLDAYVKDDSFAQEWLDKDARRWLGGRGELQKK